jgi:hypothetical protein
LATGITAALAFALNAARTVAQIIAELKVLKTVIPTQERIHPLRLPQPASCIF